MKIISADKLRGYIQKEHEKSYLLIDVREPIEYEDSHIPGSILLPLTQFEEQVEELPEKNLIFYCRSGVRSKAAALTADFFNEAGKEIYTLEGGILGWNGAAVEGMPLFKTFDLTKDIDDILLDAINLEKGAFRFYDYMLKYFCLDSSNDADKDVVDAVNKAKDGELGHAKLIYSHLKQVPNIEEFSLNNNDKADKKSSQTFEYIYEKLKGDILEGGTSFDDIIRLLEKQNGNKLIDILEIAISMEYRAFDLYRVMSERTENVSLKDTFYSLAQAEKSHMNILVKIFESRVSN